jgi:uncharacterized protein YybS (DUF2232 family)
MPALVGASRVVLLGGVLGLVLLTLEALEVRVGLGGATALVSLVPVAVSFAVGGPLAAAATAVVGLAGVAAAFGATAAAVVAARHAVPGLLLGLGLARRWPLAASLLAVSGASLFGLLGLVWAFVPGDTTLGALLARQVDAHIGDVERLSARLPMASDPAWMAQSTQLIAATMRTAGPAVILVGLLAVSLVNYVIGRLCLRGRSFRTFAEEAVPDHLVWAVIAGGAMLVTQHDTLTLIGLNLLIVLAPLYAIQGLAVLRHLFQRARVPRPLQSVSFGLFAIQPLLLVAAACLGLTDLWMDFRKIRQAATPA